MNRKPFKANHWFVNNSRSKNQTAQLPTNVDRQNPSISIPVFPTFDNTEQLSSEHNQGMNRFFTPGWKGESLISKEVKKFLNVLDRLHQDVKYTFDHIPNLY